MSLGRTQAPRRGPVSPGRTYNPRGGQSTGGTGDGETDTGPERRAVSPGRTVSLGEKGTHTPGGLSEPGEMSGPCPRSGAVSVGGHRDLRPRREAVSLGNPYHRGAVILVEGAPCPGERESASGTWGHQVQGIAFPPWGATLGGQRPLRGRGRPGGLQFAGFGFSLAHPAWPEWGPVWMRSHR